MCGILFDLAHGKDGEKSLDAQLLRQVALRGPDAQRTVVRRVGDATLTFASSVLHLRGADTVVQPVVDTFDNVLCWNGEAWYGLEVADGDNDTSALSEVLSRASGPLHDVFECLRGPYAFVYLQVASSKLWFSRDILGRRSLLIRRGPDGFTLSSVARRGQEGWQEVKADGLHCYDLSTREFTMIPWSEAGDESSTLKMTRSYPPVRTDLPDPMFNLRDRTHQYYLDAVLDFEKVLLEAIRIRTQILPRRKETEKLLDCRVAVMYSGGVDCALIARMLHDVLPPEEPVDLLNVSFENPRSINNAKLRGDSFSPAETYSTPDRLTGIQGFEELRATCPSRNWRFVEIDVPYSLAQSAKSEVLDLMYPNDSVMDYSIALAFYFCARGRGTIRSARPDDAPYDCPARVYFSGLGADEQLGGYSRHIQAFRRAGHAGLLAELQLDLDRLPSRNLGRDDRVISRFGREVRWPFLDERVIGFLSRLRVDQKMDLALAAGGDKLLLRELARRLGIHKAAGERKRAIQFGSRSAKMEVEAGNRVRGHGVQT